MAHEVFISYSIEDTTVADEVCKTLERRDISCWVAPRDVPVGQNFAEAIINALNQSRIVVVILSAASNISQYVNREVERAVSKGLPIVPLRIEDVALSKPMELYLSSTHWLDAITPPLEDCLEELVDIVDTLKSTSYVEAQKRPLQKSALTAEDILNRKVFIGRERELKQLEAIFDRVLVGHGTIVTVEGEPGVGKSELCEKLESYANLHGASVLRGHCEESSIPYLPFVEAIRSYVTGTSVRELRKNQTSATLNLARIVPELKDKLNLKVPPSGDPLEERYRLMQSVLVFLTNAAISKPTLLVIEDLHDADKGSLEMLTHLARGLAKAPLLIISTYRDTEVDRNQPLLEALADMRRISSYRRIKLCALTEEDVRSMLGALTRQRVSQSLARAIYEKTEGNPLFVNEVVRYLTEKANSGNGKSGAITVQLVRKIGIPKELHGVIVKRLSKLSPNCNRILSIGAIIGREFPLELLKRLTQLPEAELFPALREAKEAMIVEEMVNVGADVTYRFNHDFFKETIYEEIIAPERLVLHQKVAKAIESLYASRLAEYAVELTEHFCHSTNPEDMEKAVRYGEMAAKQARDVYAHGEEVRLLEHTLRVQVSLDVADKTKRCDLLLALGDALINEGEPRRILDIEAPAAWSLVEAMHDTVRSSRVCHLAMLALFYYGIGRAWMTPEAALWAERAQRNAQPDTVASARADTATGIVKCANNYLEEGVYFLNRAIETARRLGDNDTYWWAASVLMLYASGFKHDEELVSLADELARGSRESVSTGVLIWTLIMMTDTFLDHAKRLDADKIWYEARQLIQRNGQAHYQAFSMAGNALFDTLDGYLERAVHTINALTEQSKEQGFAELAEIQIFMIGLRPLIYLGLVDKALAYFTTIVSPAAKSLCLAHNGKLAEANAILEQWIAPRFTDQYDESKDETPIYGDTLLLETAVLVENSKAVKLLLRRLDQSKSRSTGIFHATCIDRHMGAAASLLGRYDQARNCFQRALEVSRTMRFRPEIALTRLQTAELLLFHFPDESDEALEHLNLAISEFREMKMKPSLERALKLKRSQKFPEKS